MERQGAEEWVDVALPDCVMHEARADADAAPRVLALALSRALQPLAICCDDSGQSALIDIIHLGVRPSVLYPACLASSPFMRLTPIASVERPSPEIPR